MLGTEVDPPPAQYVIFTAAPSQAPTVLLFKNYVSSDRPDDPCLSPSLQEAEAGGSELQGHLQLYLGYLGLHLKTAFPNFAFFVKVHLSELFGEHTSLCNG